MTHNKNWIIDFAHAKTSHQMLQALDVLIAKHHLKSSHQTRQSLKNIIREEILEKGKEAEIDQLEHQLYRNAALLLYYLRTSDYSDSSGVAYIARDISSALIQRRALREMKKTHPDLSLNALNLLAAKSTLDQAAEETLQTYFEVFDNEKKKMHQQIQAMYQASQKEAGAAHVKNIKSDLMVDLKDACADYLNILEHDIHSPTTNKSHSSLVKNKIAVLLKLLAILDTSPEQYSSAILRFQSELHDNLSLFRKSSNRPTLQFLKNVSVLLAVAAVIEEPTIEEVHTKRTNNKAKPEKRHESIFKSPASHKQEDAGNRQSDTPKRR